MSTLSIPFTRAPLARRSRVVAFAVLVTLCQPGAGSAADPFYDRLLRDGVQALDAGDFPLAAENLRLACFGLLDEPVVLARGLTYLALAQAEIDDQPAFSRTFDRILEVERRFDAFSQLELSPDLRRTLEGWLERWIEFDVLDSVPAFRETARCKLEAELVDLPADQRRPVLQRLVTVEPESSTWGLQLAQLELERGDFEAVLAAASQVLAHHPLLDQALCLRGRAGLAMDSCQQALADLELCPELVDGLFLIEPRLRCLVRLGDWQGASLLLRELHPDRRKRAPFRQLAREVRKGLKAAPVVQDPVAAPVPEESPGQGEAQAAGPAEPDVLPITAQDILESASPTAEESPPEDPASWPPELTTELEGARQLASDGSREQLGDALAAARELADRYRQLTEPQHLAAEIAYRLSRWSEAVTYFERGGEPEPRHPDRLFYFAVALFETGNRAAAREMLERCLPSLERTAFVRSYVEKILEADRE